MRLVRTPNNPVHHNAIEVLDGKGRRVGYIPRDLADVMSPALDSGYIRITKCIACITSKGIKAIEVYYEK